MKQFDGDEQLPSEFRPIFNGIYYRHRHIPADKSNSSCYDQIRKNRVNSEAVVCINQAMQVFTDFQMLSAGIPTTNDGCNLIRHGNPTLFETKFTQVTAVLQSYPFTLDLAFLSDIRLALVGKLNDQMQLEKVEGYL